MATEAVGVQEFQENLARYLDSDSPITITRDGTPVGRFFPARRMRTEAEKAEFEELTARWEKELQTSGITEEEIEAEIDQALREAKVARRAAR
jgi:antitoxin (DNA-binding transcriptional repressor) of toxin-antitoxin stability system